MTRNRDRSLDATGQPKIYKPADPLFRIYNRGVGTLSVDGELVGHLASRVLDWRVPSRPWIWFVLVWLDGRREFKFEDYAPRWYVIRELDAGYFDHHGPRVHSEKRLFGLRLRSSMPGPPVKFDFAWLPTEAAAKKWKELGLVDADF